jgi:hypothetical protein
MNAATPERKPTTEEISGLIERVTFHNDESGFCVLRVKAQGHREEMTVVGSLPAVTAGEWLVADGWWIRDKEHGLQFKAAMMKTVPPTTTAASVALLAMRKKPGVPLPKIWTAPAAFTTNAASAMTMLCSGMDAVSRSRPSRNASDSLGQKCNSLNLSTERFPSIMQTPNSTSTVDKFTPKGDIFIGPLG